MWFKVDDGWSAHPKVRRAGKDGRALWMAAGCRCAKNGTAVVDDLMLRDAAHEAEVSNYRKAMRTLVDVGLWHDCDSDCDRCEPTPAGAFSFHDWWDYQPTNDETKIPLERIRWKRRKALSRDRELCERIVQRDKNRCRYCSVRVDWKDRRGPTGGTYDHVDPDGDNSMGNVVVACRGCNTAKADRTPAEAGMPLLKPGTDLAGARSGQNGSGRGPVISSPSRARGDGPGPARSVPASGQVGSVPVLAPAKSNGNGAKP